MILLQTLSDAHARALRVTLAADMHPAFVRLVSALLPEAACELLALLAPGTAKHREALLRDNLVAWWPHAPAELTAAVRALPQAGARAELLAALLQQPTADEALRRDAYAALAAESEPYARARALLALARAGEVDRVAEAAVLLPRLPVWSLARLCADWAGLWSPSQREQVRALAESASNRAWAAEVFIALARAAPPAEAPADALRALSCMRDDSGWLRGVWHVPVLASVLSPEELRPFIHAHLLAARTRADPAPAIASLAPLADLPQLERMVAMLAAPGGHDHAWDRAAGCADLSRSHTARRAELREGARAWLGKTVGPVGPEAPAYPPSEDWVSLSHAVHALVRVSAAVEGEERRWLQRAALARVAAESPHYEERETLSPYVWRWLGEPLDPSLRTACIDTLLGLADRFSCWGALGEVAACFPPPEQRLALGGLRRIADPPRLNAPEWVAEALGRAEAAASTATADETSPVPPDAHDGAWSDADAAQLAALEREVERRVRRVGGSDGGYMLHRCCSELTLPAARRAVALAHTLTDADLRAELWAKLVSASPLARSPVPGESRAALIEALGALAEAPGYAPPLEDVAARLLALCPPDDPELPRWAERVARLLSRPGEAINDLFERAAQLAGVLHRLGGPQLIAALGALRERGLPPPTFAQPTRDGPPLLPE